MAIVIHAEPNIGWQGPFALKIQRGLRKIGYEAVITPHRQRISDTAILLGTTLWRGVEATGHYLLVDRASFGDPDFVQLVWNGHGRRGNHCVPEDAAGRWQAIRGDLEIQPWRTGGGRTILCGQTESYSPHYRTMDDWYHGIFATHFRQHPAGSNPTILPLARDWFDAHLAITLNSSVAVDAVMNGIPTVTMDEAAMAWNVTSHEVNVISRPEREDWLEWLSWTQWHYDEIAAGEPIAHLFEGI